MNNIFKSILDHLRGLHNKVTQVVSLTLIAVIIAGIALYVQIREANEPPLEIDEKAIGEAAKIDTEEIRKATRLQTPELSMHIEDLDADPSELVDFLFDHEDEVIQINLSAAQPREIDVTDDRKLLENYLFLGARCAETGECAGAEINFHGDCVDGYCGGLDSAGNRTWSGYVIVDGNDFAQGWHMISLKMIPKEEARLRK